MTRREYHLLPQFSTAPLNKTLLYLELNNQWDLRRDEIFLQALTEWYKREFELDNYKLLKGVPKFWD
jgi:hypothetical protein